MKEKEQSRWRKLDNAAQAFPAATDKKDTRVFRFYCQLGETVDGDLLQEALDKTVEKYPVFQAVLRKGLFWFYLEHRDIRARAKAEKKKPCSRIYMPDAKKLLFEVTYYKNRINLEVFHALSDGTGSIRFLRELVKNYLILAHKELEDIPLEDESETLSDFEEDSFSQYYYAGRPKAEKPGPKAFQLPGPKLERSDMEITEMVVPVSQILEKARSYGVSMTVFLTSIFMCAIHEEMTARQQRRPVTIMVPVDLRQYFPSSSMTNFWGWLEAGYHFHGETSFEDVLTQTKQFFEKELVKERVASRMNDYIRLEKNPFLRAVPLEIKNLFLQAGTRLRSGNITAILSNVGKIKMPQPYAPLIQRFGVFTSTDKMQLCACSYGDELVLGFSSKLMSTNIQRNFARMLKDEGISCEISENVFPPQDTQPRYPGRQAFQWFSFAAITAAVVCIMANIMIDAFIWAPFACGGILCLWVCGAVGYVKRRNILKNLMWQVVIATLFCVAWDLITGWRGWSVDFVFPIAVCGVLLAMFIIARVRHLETPEYLIYFIMDTVLGLVPLVLYAAGVVHFIYPSIICGGICFLTLVRLLIFRYRDMSSELHKKFRL